MADTTELQFILKMRDEASAVLNQHAGAVEKVSKKHHELKESTEEAAKAQAELIEKFNGIREFLEPISAVILSFEVLTQGIEEASKLDAAKSSYRAFTESTVAGMEAVGEAAKQMTTDTSFGADEAVKSIETLQRSGESLAAAMLNTKSVMDLAVIGQTSLAEAATITSEVLAAFHLEADQASNAIDVIAAVAQKTNISVTQLSSSLSRGAALAANSGVSFNEYAAGVGLLTKQGINAAFAGRELSSVTDAMITPTDDAAKVMRALGLSLADLNPRDLVGTFEKLAKAGLSSSQAIHLFGSSGSQAATSILNSLPAFRQLVEASEHAGGKAHEMAEIIEASFEGMQKKINAALNAMADALVGSGIFQGLKNIQEGILHTIDNVTDFITKMEQVPGVTKFITVMTEAISSGLIALAGLFAILSAIGGTIGVLGLVSSALGAFPWLAVAAGISAAITVLSALSNLEVSVGEKTVKLGTLTYFAFKVMIDGAKAAWSEITKLPALFERMINTFITGSAEGSKALDKFALSATTGAYGIDAAFTDVGGQIATSFIGDVGQMGMAMRDFANTTIGEFNAIADVLNFIQTVMEGIGTTIKNIGLQIGTMFADVGSIIADMWHDDLAKLQVDSKQFLADMQKNLAGVDIGKKFSELKGQIATDMSTDYVGAIGDMIQKLIDGLKDGTIKTLEEIEKKAQEIEEKTKEGGNTKIASTIGSPGVSLNPAVVQFYNAINDGLRKLYMETAALGLSADAHDRLVTKLNLEDAARKAGIEDIGKVVDAYMKEYDAAKQARDAFEGNPLAGMQMGLQQFADEGAKLADSFASAWKGALDGVADQLASLIVTGKGSFKDILKTLQTQLLSGGIKKIMSDALNSSGLGSLFGNPNKSAADKALENIANLKTIDIATAVITIGSATLATGATAPIAAATPSVPGVSSYAPGLGNGPRGTGAQPPASSIAAIRAAAAAAGVPFEDLVAEAGVETNNTFKPNLTSPTGARGLFQFTRGTGKQYGLNDSNIFDPTANATAAAKLYADNKAALMRSMGTVPTGGQIYAAHQLGIGGVQALMGHTDQTAGDAYRLAGLGAHIGDLSANNINPQMRASDALAKINAEFENSKAKALATIKGQTTETAKELDKQKENAVEGAKTITEDIKKAATEAATRDIKPIGITEQQARAEFGDLSSAKRQTLLDANGGNQDAAIKALQQSMGGIPQAANEATRSLDAAKPALQSVGMAGDSAKASVDGTAQAVTTLGTNAQTATPQVQTAAAATATAGANAASATPAVGSLNLNIGGIATMAASAVPGLGQFSGLIGSIFNVISSSASGIGGIFSHLFGLKDGGDTGKLTGPGTGTSDSIPAMVKNFGMIMLSNGEYIVNAASTKKFGPLLDAINDNDMHKVRSHFASGGPVDSHQMAGMFSAPSSYPAEPQAPPATVFNFEQHITNSSNATVRTKETDDGRGGKRQDIVIEDAVGNAVSKPGSRANQAMQSSFNARPSFRRR